MNNQWYYPAYYWLPTWQPRKGVDNYQYPYYPESSSYGYNGVQPYGDQRFNSEGLNNQQMSFEGAYWENQRNNNGDGYASQIQQQNTNENVENNLRSEESHKANGPSNDFRDQITEDEKLGRINDINNIITIDAAINIARGKFAGEVVRAELNKQNPAWVYRVDYITSDDMKDTIEVDVNTGEIVETV